MKKQKQKNYTLFDKYKVIKIENFIANNFIKNFHYLHSYPTEIKNRNFGLYENENLIGVCSFGACVSWRLTFNSINKISPDNFIELNRLVLKDNLPNQASFLVSRSLKLLPKPKVVVSYADTAQDHAGIIYQACNFLFTGTTKARTDIAGKDGRHSRHHLGDRQNRINRSAKHRYVYFIGSKKDKKTLRNALRYTIEDTYPKLYQE